MITVTGILIAVGVGLAVGMIAFIICDVFSGRKQ